MKAGVKYGILSIALIMMSNLHAIKYDPVLLAKLSLVDLRTKLDKARKINDPELIGQLTTQIKRLEAEEGIVVKGARKEDIFIRNSQTGELTALTGEKLTAAKALVTTEFPAGVPQPTMPPAGFTAGEGEWIWIKAGENRGPAWHPTVPGTIPVDPTTNVVVGSFTPASSSEVAALPSVSVSTPSTEIPVAPEIPSAPPISGEIPPAPSLEGVPFAPPIGGEFGGPPAPPLPPGLGGPEGGVVPTKAPPAPVAQRLPVLAAEQIAALTLEEKAQSDATVSKQLAMLAERYPKNLSPANYINDVRGGKVDEGLEVLLRDKDRYPFIKLDELQQLVGGFNKSNEGLISAFAGLGKTALKRLADAGLNWDTLPQLDAVDRLKNNEGELRQVVDKNIAMAHGLFDRLLFNPPSQQFNDAVELIVMSLMALNRKLPQSSETITLANITSDQRILALVSPDPLPDPIPTPKMLVSQMRKLLVDPLFQLYQPLMTSPIRVADLDKNTITAMQRASTIQMLTDPAITDTGRNEKFIALDIMKDFLFQKESDETPKIASFIAEVLKAGRAAKALEKPEVPAVAFNSNEFIQKQLPTIKTFVDLRKAVETVTSKAVDKDIKDMLNALATVLKETPEAIVFLPIDDLLAGAKTKEDVGVAAAATLEYIKESIPQAEQAMYNQMKTWLILLQKVAKKPTGEFDILNDLTLASGQAVVDKARSLQKEFLLYLDVLASFRKLLFESRKASSSGRGERTYRGIEFINAVKALQQNAQLKDKYILANLLKALSSITRTPDSVYTYMNKFFGPMVGSLEDLKIKKEDFILMFEEYGTLLDALKQIAALSQDKQYEALYNSLRALNTSRLEPGVEYVAAVSLGAPGGRYTNKLTDLFNALPTKNQLATINLMDLSKRFADFRQALISFIKQPGIGLENTKEFQNILYNTLLIIYNIFIQTIRERLEAINKGTALTIPELETSGKQSKRNIAFLTKLQQKQACAKLLKIIPTTIGEFNQDAFVAAIHDLFALNGIVMKASAEMVDNTLFATGKREEELSDMRASLRRYLLSIENALEAFKKVAAEEPVSGEWQTSKTVVDLLSVQLSPAMTSAELDAVSMVIAILIVADASPDVILKDCIERINLMRSINSAIQAPGSPKQALLLLREEAGDPFIEVKDIQSKDFKDIEAQLHEVPSPAAVSERPGVVLPPAIASDFQAAPEFAKLSSDMQKRFIIIVQKRTKSGSTTAVADTIAQMKELVGVYDQIKLLEAKPLNQRTSQDVSKLNDLEKQRAKLEDAVVNAAGG